MASSDVIVVDRSMTAEGRKYRIIGVKEKIHIMIHYDIDIPGSCRSM